MLVKPEVDRIFLPEYPLLSVMQKVDSVLRRDQRLFLLIGGAALAVSCLALAVLRRDGRWAIGTGFFSIAAVSPFFAPKKKEISLIRNPPPPSVIQGKSSCASPLPLSRVGPPVPPPIDWEARFNLLISSYAEIAAWYKPLTLPTLPSLKGGEKQEVCERLEALIAARLKQKIKEWWEEERKEKEADQQEASAFQKAWNLNQKLVAKLMGRAFEEKDSKLVSSLLLDLPKEGRPVGKKEEGAWLPEIEGEKVWKKRREEFRAFQTEMAEKYKVVRGAFVFSLYTLQKLALAQEGIFKLILGTLEGKVGHNGFEKILISRAATGTQFEAYLRHRLECKVVGGNLRKELERTREELFKQVCLYEATGIWRGETGRFLLQVHPDKQKDLSKELALRMVEFLMERKRGGAEPHT